MFEHDDKKNTESTKTKGVFLSNRHASFVVSGGLLFSFIVFIGGYFLGQKNTVDHFSNKVEQESFADQLYSSMCMMHENKDNELNESEEVVVVQVEQPEISKATQVVTQAPVQEAEKSLVNDEPQKQYYAQLVGFGTEKAAQQFRQRLRKKNIDVIVNRRRSKTSKGKTVSWYQVVTQKFNDQDNLNNLVETISEQERLKGVRIVTC